jgi:outer membrane protein OmpA-like peptidoglycan-associated protein
VIDNCPNKKGIRALAGCPDRDGDRVADDFDACPDQFGEVRYNGCADTDFDGILDSDDACPTEKGLYKLKGCPDTDEDGVPDVNDKCPDTRGLLGFAGCPPNDTNGDGDVNVLDELSAKKELIETKETILSDVSDLVVKVIKNNPNKNDGDPDFSKENVKSKSVVSNNPTEQVSQPREQPANNRITTYSEAVSNKSMAVFSEALYGIQFELGTANIKSKSFNVLDKVVRYMQKNANANYEIGGHTDNQGSATDNQKLSEARAKAVETYLISKGVLSQRLTSRGYGSTNPIDNNENTVGRLLNRRIVFSSF